MKEALTLLSILLPLIIGFFVRLGPVALEWVNSSLTFLVYVILALMGLSLAAIPNLAEQALHIGQAASVLFLCIIVCNLLALMWFDRKHPSSIVKTRGSGAAKVGLAGSMKQIACVVGGVVVGKMLPNAWLPADGLGHYVLMLLIFLVGVQLGGSGISLRRILLDKRGVQTSVVFVISSALGGVLFALLTQGVSLSQGLALSSGYGWYSLSGIVMSRAYSPLWGSVALMNDLAREFFALVFIPLLMRRHLSAAVGVGGATSLDFALPVLRASGGIGVVPVAISFGFIANMVAPVLMIVFSSVHF